MTRISLAEEYDNRDMVAQMIALKNRQTESENNLLTYVAQCAQSAADADSAKDDAEAARDTAVSTVSDCVKMHPGALQVIRDYPLQSVNGFVGSLVGNATSATSATTASKLGSSTVGSTTKPIYLNGGTATLCNEMCDLTSAQTVSGDKTFTGTTKAPTPGVSAGSTEVVTVGYVSDTGGTLNNLLHTNADETYTGMKTYRKTAAYSNVNARISDYDGSAQATVWLGGTKDSNDGWLTTESLGAEGDGRAYYDKTIKLKTANHYAAVDIRMWLDDAGNMTIGILNPITNAWKTVVLQ